jgi:hypothetical protein
MTAKSFILLVIIILITISLPVIGKYAGNILIFEDFDAYTNRQMVYQSITLAITFLLLLLLRKSKPREFLQHFKKGEIDAPIIPEPLAGIKPKENENWLHLGKNFALVISLVTALVIYFQLFSNSTIGFNLNISRVVFTMFFALSNSFVEEMITRLGIVVVLKDLISDKKIALSSGILFGAVHFFGTPGGITGVFVAGFLGWFLAKSILETRGVFWAWLIHFIQDVIIIGSVYMIME